MCLEYLLSIYICLQILQVQQGRHLTMIKQNIHAKNMFNISL